MDVCLLSVIVLSRFMLTIAQTSNGFSTSNNCTSDFNIEFREFRHNVSMYGILKCNIHCPINCSCSLTDEFLQINCTDKVVSEQVEYPMKLSYLSWADCRLKSIQRRCFTGLANTLLALNLSHNGLQRISSGQFETLMNLLSLEIGNNALTYLDVDAFKGLGSLQQLDLFHNNMAMLEHSVFRDLSQLRVLYLGQNRLTTIQSGPFDYLSLLHSLALNDNQITNVQQHVFMNLTKLYKLSLQNNLLSSLNASTFNGLSSLRYLHIRDNCLSIIHSNAFRTLTNLNILELRNNSLTFLHPRMLLNQRDLIVLDLSFNNIQTMHHDVFQTQMSLRVLQMRSTGLKSLPNEIFSRLESLQYLSIPGNEVHALESFLFQYNRRLETLDLEHNDLGWIEPDAFYGLTNKTQLFVDNPGSCCFAEEYVGKCHATHGKSPFLTCKRLLAYDFLRAGIWIVSILAIAGNIVVYIFGYSNSRKINKVQSIYIRNLSISDFLMGIYLIILLSVDLYYTNYFPSHSESWRSSVLCRVAGFLSVLSSEASVFFITLISVDRLIRVKYPLIGHRLGPKFAKVFVISMWLIAVGLSIISVVLASGRNSDRYSVSEVCVGLPLSRYYHYNFIGTLVELPYGFKTRVILTKPSGKRIVMYFPLFIFTLLNLLCFTVVGICYFGIFVVARKSSKRTGRGSISRNEIRMAEKLFLIVFTDFCCWVPIGILSILAQTGAVEIHPVAYAWIATFILPINSSLNPFIYTLGDVISDRIHIKCCQIQPETGRTKVSKIDNSKQENCELQPCAKCS